MLGDRGGRGREGKHIDCVCPLVWLDFHARLAIIFYEFVRAGHSGGIIVLSIVSVHNLFFPNSTNSIIQSLFPLQLKLP